jgi:hypothetical protein
LSAKLELRNVARAGPTPPSAAAFAREDVHVGDVLAEIPKAWCLTRTTGSISLVLPRSVSEPLDEEALILTVMHERARGEESPWWPYLSTIPRREGLDPNPGSELEARLREDYRKTTEARREHFRKLRAFFPDGDAAPPDEVFRRDASSGAGVHANAAGNANGASRFDASREEVRFEIEGGALRYGAFVSAAALVKSRAIRVDDRLGKGLVPVVDLFSRREGGDAHARLDRGGDDSAFLRLIAVSEAKRGEAILAEFGEERRRESNL